MHSSPEADRPQVSVVIPTRDRWPLLSTTLGGALRQVDVELEVIVVDDGSTDETPRRLAELRDGRLRVIRREQSGGVASARNEGIEAAQGAWLAFLDDDDLWAPSKLRAQLDAAARRDAVFVYTAAIVLDDREVVIELERAPDPDRVASELLAFDVIPGGCSTVIAPTELVRRVGAFDERLSVLADWDLWLRLVAEGPAAACEEPLVGYRRHARSMHVTDVDHLFGEMEYILAKHRAAREGRGLAFDPIGYSRWLALAQRQAGRRLGAARLYFRTGLAYRSLGNLARAAAVMLGWGRRPPVEADPLQEPPWLADYR